MTIIFTLGSHTTVTSDRILMSSIAMAGIITFSNLLVLVPVNDWFTAGTLVYPVTFLLTDITNR
jgi:uncharacterized PurR-regulated membrane protein YhhQ (DUF165 family)